MGWPIIRLLFQYSIDRNNGSCSLTALSNSKVIQFAHCTGSPILQHLHMADHNVELMIGSC